MNHALILNLAILLLAAVGAILTHNPLWALLILAVQELPHGLQQQELALEAQAMGLAAGGDDDDEGEPAIGFTADVR